MSRRFTLRQLPVWLTLLMLVFGPALARAHTLHNDDDDALEYTGIVESMPAQGRVGTWIIGEHTFQTTSTTQFGSQTIAVGTCVELDYTVVNDQRLVREMHAGDDCTDDGGDDGGDGDDDGDERRLEVRGLIESMPPRLVGAWQVSGISYIATPMTRFEQEDGPFAVGNCVEIEYRVQDDTNMASSIKTDDCGGEDDHEALGILQALPAAPHVGTWTISGTSYDVTISTVLDREHGDFYIGACVEVQHDGVGTALKIETKSNDDCTRLRATPPQPTIKARGLVTQIPDGLFGAWIIGGHTYEARSGVTSFDQEYGELALNQCAEVRYFTEGTTRVATEVSSERMHQCGAATEQRTIFGVIEALPSTADLRGTWTVGGLSYQVTANTKLKDGPFAVGLLVKLKYVRAADGTLVVSEIEGKHKVDDDDQQLAKVFGRIDSLPSSSDRRGAWTIAGTTYTVDQHTRLKEKAGAFQTGACVEMYYRTADDGTRVAGKIETRANACASFSDGVALNKAYGFAEQLPPNGFVGTWLVGGVAYEVQSATKFEEERGALVLGAFVELLYTVQDGVNIVHKIETHVPPQAGEVDRMGRVSEAGDDTRMLQAISPTATSTTQIWKIGGQRYQVTSATMLDDSAGALQSGQAVSVNAYIDANGALVATSIAAIDLHQLYLPVGKH